MAKKYRAVIVPSLLSQLGKLGLTEQASRAIRDAMSNPDQAGKQLTGALYPHRRLKVGRYRIIYRVHPDKQEVHFLYCAIRKEGSRQDVYRQIARVLNRDEL